MRDFIKSGLVNIINRLNDNLNFLESKVYDWYGFFFSGLICQ